MRHGRRIASCLIGVVLVLSATVWINSRRPIRAQSPARPAPAVKVAAAPPDALPSFDNPGPPVLSDGAPVPEIPQANTALPAPNTGQVLPPPELGAPPVPPAAALAEDPDQAAEAFVNQTRQQAESQIKELTTEAEQLRARLKKVEGAIERWKTLRSALDRKPGQEAAGPVPEPPRESERRAAPADLAFPVAPGPEATALPPRDRNPAEPAPSALPPPRSPATTPEPPRVDQLLDGPRAESPQPATAAPEPPLKPQ